MLVQKRVAGEEEPALEDVKPVPTIRVKAKHCGMTHEIYISAEATFGDVRKMVAERAGAHPDDLKVRYKDKERDAKAFLDMAGVKDRSRITVVDDPEARARRLLEERRQGHLQKASKAVAAVAAEVDKIAPKVSVLEALVRKGERVAEKDVATVTERRSDPSSRELAVQTRGPTPGFPSRSCSIGTPRTTTTSPFFTRKRKHGYNT